MLKPREARQSVVFTVRIRQDSGWTDACIRNISSRGLKLEMKSPPPKGSFIEIRRGSLVIVGQVRWSEPNCCGLRTQDRITVAQLQRAQAEAAAASKESGYSERRATVRVLTPEEIAERSRMKSALFQRVILIAAVVVGAIILATSMFDVMQKPMAKVAEKLG